MPFVLTLIAGSLRPPGPDGWSFSGNGRRKSGQDSRTQKSCRLAPGEILNALKKLAKIALAEGIGSAVDLLGRTADIVARLRDLAVKFAGRPAHRIGDAR